MKCKVCGNEVTPSKHAWNKIYCSKQCREKARTRNYKDEYDKRLNYFYNYYLRLIKPTRNLHNIHSVGTLFEKDLKVVNINGQERIKGKVTLERLIMDMRREDVYSP